MKEQPDQEGFKKITLTADQMKSIARYGLTFAGMVREDEPGVPDVNCPEVYSFTLDDLYLALKAIREANPTVKDVRDYWFEPIMQLDEAFDLGRALGEMEDGDDTPGELAGFPGYLFSESEYFRDVWWSLEDLCHDDGDENDRINDAWYIDEHLKKLENYMANKWKPVEAWMLSDEDKADFVEEFADDETVNEAPERALALCRKFADELCAKDNHIALCVKGYACYGGNRLYPCDWKASRDCISRLFELDDDPQYANTLGYIYYYGRCNGGVPEYDKAFRYFTFAAANGLYEATYKLADMYLHGYSCRKSPRTAKSLYQTVYLDSFNYFIRGEHASFADAALRMGNVYAQGINAEPDPERAYYYYTQAEYANNLRSKDDSFFGNKTVAVNIWKAMDEVKEKLPEGYFRDYIDNTSPLLIARLAEENYSCSLTRKKDDQGCWTITGERIATNAVKEPLPILITLPQARYCARTDTVSLTLEGSSEVWFMDDQDTVQFNFCCPNEELDRYEFFNHDQLTAWVRSSCFRFHGNPATRPHGQEYRLASVCFHEGGRSYDYLCEDKDVQPGDRVIVMGYEGETEVTVTDVFTKRESELPLPVEKYSKVLRKAMT